MARKEKLLLLWVAVSFCLLFSGLLMFGRRPRVLNVLDALFFIPAFVYAIKTNRTNLLSLLKKHIPLLFFLLYATVSTFFSDAPNPSRFLRAFFHIFTFFIFVETIIRRAPKAFWGGMLIGVCFASVIAIIDFYCYYFVVGRPFTSELYGGLFETFQINRFITLDTNQLYASMYFITLPFFAFLASSRLPKSWATTLAPYFATMLIVIYLIANQRRSTLVALMAGCLVLPLVTLKKRLLIPLALIVAVAGSILAIHPGMIVDRGSSNRIVIWEGTWEMIKERPLFGHGMSNKTEAIHIVRPMDGVHEAIDHPHNYYLSLVYYLGFLGLALWTMIWLPTALKSLRQGRQAHLSLAALTTGLAAVLFDGIHPYTPFMYNWPSVWIPMALLIGIYRTQHNPILQKVS
ncbi:O-antigen ligase [Alloalcanivorax xenomutans]|uniref:O-antigen ligase family protein n=1 Tax=Alloalcanivorax xenomutans TaxID=1094342 RepID=UPI0006D5C8D6|nr:O-antigen ligase family protein [Alloalcanivorax xenomutans]PHS67858.1 MAG: hypothetical protein COB00_08190 [Alcanivorax sp.]CUR44488.1 hypothetical protein BN2364_0047 [Alloalcanivorax xenomutans]SOB91182.1 O-antigen ligase [Alloalcanivorax xenomutans]